MASEAKIRRGFRTQRDFCVKMGAPVTAAVCDALADALDRVTRTGRRVLDWPGDPIADALPLRLVGGLHAVALGGKDADAVAAFAADTAPDERIARLRAVIERHDAAILPWLDRPPQTNEIARAGPLMLGLMAVTRRFGQPIELLEIGSSAGLNLLIDRFSFDLGGVQLGNPQSPVRIVPEWRGPPPEPADVRIVATRGVDVQPIDLTDSAQAARLRSYVWADNPERLARLDTATMMLKAAPVRLDRGDAADWLESRLVEPQAAGKTRVLMHSVVWQYLGAGRQARIERAMAAAGARADPRRPLAWVRMEPRRDLARHELWVESWPGAGPRQIAITHAHGSWIEPVE